MLGRFELDKIYNEDAYKAIKDLPSGSIDLVYCDIPYGFEGNGGGGCFGEKNVIITLSMSVCQKIPKPPEYISRR